MDLYLTGRDTACDVTATNASGDIVWRRLEGEVMQGILRLEVIGPGETLEFTETWDQRDKTGDLVTPGLYTLRGIILTDGSVTLQAEPVTLRIAGK